MKYESICAFTGSCGMAFGMATQATMGSGWSLFFAGGGFVVIFLLSMIGVEIVARGKS